VSHREALIAASVPLEDLPDADPGEVMQLLINRVTQLVRHAAAEADLLKPGLAKNQARDELEHEQWSHWDEQGNLVVMSNYWLLREEQLRRELANLTEKAQALGLAERNTRVREAQFMMVASVLKAACEAAGIGPKKQAELGRALEHELEVVEGRVAA
jgi:ABC-type branched-subunit amino acid transport system substrate-binding protein